jgi:hypothetical protein
VPHREDERGLRSGVAQDRTSREVAERAAGKEDTAAIGRLIGVAERIDRLVGKRPVPTIDPDLSRCLRGTESARGRAAELRIAGLTRSAGCRGASHAGAARAGVGERARVAVVALNAVGLGGPDTIPGAVARVHTTEVEPLAARRAGTLELARRGAAIAAHGVPVIALLARLERTVSTGRERVASEGECEGTDAEPTDPRPMPRDRGGIQAGCSHVGTLNPPAADRQVGAPASASSSGPRSSATRARR